MPSDYRPGRDSLVAALREEVMGPVRRGASIDCTSPIAFDTEQAAFGPFVQQASGDEIVQRDTPLQRYGVGILYPSGTVMDPVDESSPITANLPDADETQRAISEAREFIDQQLDDNLQRMLDNLSGADDESTEDGPIGLDLSGANDLRPSTMAVSLYCRLPEDATVRVKATGGRYVPLAVSVAGKQRRWWLRQQVELEATFQAAALRGGARMVEPTNVVARGAGPVDLRATIRSRTYPDGTALLTVCLTNRTDTDNPQSLDSKCLMQARFGVEVYDTDRDDLILAYPEAEPSSDSDAEEESIALLYRNQAAYGVGHGCAADWSDPTPDFTVVEVRAEPLPVVETPSTTPDVQDGDGNPLVVPMLDLTKDGDWTRGKQSLAHVLDAYELWIVEKKAAIANLAKQHQAAASRHIDDCFQALRRMREGLALLADDGDPEVRIAFQLANRAMLEQQMRQGAPTRLVSISRGGLKQISPGLVIPDVSTPPPGRGSWRAFQIAFLLMALPSMSRGDHADRLRVELIWFPTGGGKTEAYLGLTAFAVFLRRIRNPDDAGTEVIMRYTLRLLTVQQFQRAAALICAMEHLRRQDDESLGSAPISLGIWLGTSVTPNRRSEAIDILNDLRKTGKSDGSLLISKCPWCGAEMGKRIDRKTGIVAGYESQGDRVIFRCPDSSCDFSSARGLPISVVDEDLYESPPSLLIGTVDKFAMLAWQPHARSLFGIGPEGVREGSPPGLIIQDELHLITGPLGSMVGLYESVIEDLCTGPQQGGEATRPKIISSTATVRRYEEQVRALYARESVSLFPPPGIDASDSFFARWARNEDQSLASGRVYVGIHATNINSMMSTQVRTYASLLQAAGSLDQEDRDPWWTMVSFFSSIRELGNALTLFQTDIPYYFTSIRNRLSIPKQEVRRLTRVEELTSRLKSDEVPGMLAALEVEAGQHGRALDAVLASSIVEVGVDIDRLSLMTILGQPKTTATYIQVTGRIGRRWKERPGLVVTILNPRRPRDRSHYERFRSYHERLYAQVEPASVTPFAPPALDRALHALMAIYVRHRGSSTQADSPWPMPETLLEQLRELLVARVQIVDAGMAGELQQAWERRIKEWRAWERTEWGRPWGTVSEDALLRTPSAHVTDAIRALTWLTPTSLRNVDAQCQAEITPDYAASGIGSTVGDPHD